MQEINDACLAYLGRAGQTTVGSFKACDSDGSFNSKTGMGISVSDYKTALILSNFINDNFHVVFKSKLAMVVPDLCSPNSGSRHIRLSSFSINQTQFRSTCLPETTIALWVINSLIMLPVIK